MLHGVFCILTAVTKSLLDSHYILVVLLMPEIVLLMFSALGILLACGTPKEVQLNLFRKYINLTICGYIGILLFYYIVGNIFTLKQIICFVAFNTLKISAFLLVMKSLVCLFALLSLFYIKRYFTLTQHVNYEYVLLLNFCVFGMFFSISANN